MDCKGLKDLVLDLESTKKTQYKAFCTSDYLKRNPPDDESRTQDYY